MFAVGCIFFFVLTGGFHVTPLPPHARDVESVRSIDGVC